MSLQFEWKKSTRSGDNGNCVEARRRNHAVQVRDSKNPSGPILTFPAQVWTAFLEGAREGEYDLG